MADRIQVADRIQKVHDNYNDIVFHPQDSSKIDSSSSCVSPGSTLASKSMTQRNETFGRSGGYEKTTNKR